MGIEFRVAGPPGTGKTTWLARAIAQAAEKQGSENVLVTSFTRAAAAALVGRDLPIPRNNVGTLHALCYHAIDRPTIAETKLSEWNEKAPGAFQLSVKGDERQMDDPLAERIGAQSGDEIMRKYQMLRNRLTPKDMWPEDVRAFDRLWVEWKDQTGYEDFTGMLERARDFYTAPGRPSVIFLDECFPGSVTVLSADGTQRPISEIVEKRLALKVVSCNVQTGMLEARQVIGWHKVALSDTRLMGSIGPLTCTADHPVYVPGFDYLPLQQYDVLDNGRELSLLEIRGEKLRSIRTSLREGAIHYSRVASWRRFDKPQFWTARERQGNLHSGLDADRLSALEAAGTSRLVQDGSNRPDNDEFRRNSISVLDYQSPGIHKNLSRFCPCARRRQAHRERTARDAKSVGACGVVHGRRIVGEKLRYHCNVRMERPRPAYSRRLSGAELRHFLSSVRGEKGNYHTHVCIRSAASVRDSCPVYAPGACVQDGTEAKAVNAIFGGYVQKEKLVLQDMRQGVRGHPLAADMQSGMLKETAAYAIGKMAKTVSRNARGARRGDVCCLQQKLSVRAPTAKQTCAANMQPKMQSDSVLGNTHNYVYCLDVEENHNFFANGILVHNCQDCVPLQWAVLRKWAKECETLVTAGDDDQCIFSFVGASPELMLDPPVPDEQMRTLHQSYRVPRAVLDLSQNWIKQVGRRWQKDYQPRMDAEEEVLGEVKHSMARWRDGDAALPVVEQALKNDHTIMILASCAYMLQPVIASLRGHGLPFHNPYRRANGSWNPLHVSRGTSVRERLLAYLRPQSETWGEDARWWTWKDVHDWAGMLKVKGVFRTGGQGRLDAIAKIHGDELSNMEQLLAEVFDEDALSMAFEQDLDWLRSNLLAVRAKNAEFPLEIIKTQGSKALLDTPRVLIGTIHSVKGGEADEVLMYPDLSSQGLRQWLTGGDQADAIRRMFYVGMTRTKWTLHLGTPSITHMSVEWGA